MRYKLQFYFIYNGSKLYRLSINDAKYLALAYLSRNKTCEFGPQISYANDFPTLLPGVDNKLVQLSYLTLHGC